MHTLFSNFSEHFRQRLIGSGLALVEPLAMICTGKEEDRFLVEHVHETRVYGQWFSFNVALSDAMGLAAKSKAPSWRKDVLHNNMERHLCRLPELLRQSLYERHFLLETWRLSPPLVPYFCDVPNFVEWFACYECYLTFCVLPFQWQKSKHFSV